MSFWKLVRHLVTKRCMLVQSSLHARGGGSLDYCRVGGQTTQEIV